MNDLQGREDDWPKTLDVKSGNYHISDSLTDYEFLR